MIEFFNNIQMWWEGLNKLTEQAIYRGISGLFFALSIGLIVGIFSYMKRCTKDENFY